MDRKVKTCYAFLDSEANVSPTELRGFLGYLFVNEPEFHHHSDSSYHYPLVQYKKVHGKMLVVGLDEYATTVYNKMVQLENIITQNEKARISNVDITMNSFTIHEEYGVYKFLSPWIALNKENYLKFKSADKTNRKEMLEKILVGNLLSMSKGLGIRIDFMINTDIRKSRHMKIEAHKNQFVAFYSEFSTNITIPKFLGLGKSVSKGFGIIERIK